MRALLVVACALSLFPGCVTLDQALLRRTAFVAQLGAGSALSVRKTPRNPLQNELNLLGWQGPSPSERTYQVLRRFGLEGVYHQDPQDALGQLRTIVASEPHLEPMYALAELSYIQGFKAKSARSHDRAMSLFAESLVTSYDYLFSPRLAGERNAYDPQFRGICDLYNVSLEEILRLLRKNGSLENGGSTSLVVDERVLPIEVRLEGRWHDSELEKLEFASDYEVEGLENKHHTYGLGVPLIAVRRDGAVPTIEDAFFPKGLSFPVTAFFREAPDSATNVAGAPRYVIQLLDPLDGPEVEIADRRAPLESDISTPLAYFMNDPVVGTHVLATFALLDADFAEDYVGLYMLEPYDPNKIPVVMVHGLWSSPTTWMEMFNDLRSMPEIRQNYQFWFYMYPSGQPFWKSAEQMREDLAKVVHTLDPDRRSTQMERMVLVGHSMGGLVSRLQTIDSGDRFWRLVSDKPLEQLAADQGSKHELQQVLYFEPNPFIQRVVSIGTPYHGSHFANGTTQWLSHQLFALSSQSTKETRELIEQNPNFFNNTDLLTINTSVDSLSPESPFLPVMLEAETAPWVHYHNVIGVLEDTSLLGKMGVQFQPEGDGIVPLDSARIPGVESELIVPAGHMVVHQHPLTILEVRRILLLHLAEGGRDVRIDRSIMPASHEQSPADVTGNHAIPASNPLPVVRLDDNGVPLASEPQVAPVTLGPSTEVPAVPTSGVSFRHLGSSPPRSDAAVESLPTPTVLPLSNGARFLDNPHQEGAHEPRPTGTGSQD